ncbi:MAG: hypothetical protein KAG97_10000 [Victivallales bacterium]|nr:hypothetical protein [Victivallales bacterium]
MNTLNAIALSGLLALSGWLHDGLTDYKAKNYEKAIIALTKVCDSKLKGSDRFKDVAFYYRAKSLLALKKKEKALEDLTALLVKHRSSEFAAETRKLYLASGGDPGQLLPERSPKEVWLTFMTAAKKGDLDAAMKLSTGKW